MDVFKLRVSDTQGILITRENVEHHTKQKYPWYQSLDGRHESHLAICPACDNTISLIGLHASDTKLNEATGKIETKTHRAPHGRHYLFRPIAGLGILDKEAYENCPYSGKTTLSQHQKHSIKSQVPSKILSILTTDFDRVIYLLSHATGIHFSYNEARKMATRYKQAQGWQYAGATVMNLPWIFGYFSRSTPLMFKSIKNETLREAIQTHYPSATFTGRHCKLEKTTEYLNPCFCFERHTRKVVSEHLEETIDLVASDDEGVEFYRETLTFDPLHFVHLINTQETTYRNKPLIELGRLEFSN